MNHSQALVSRLQILNTENTIKQHEKGHTKGTDCIPERCSVQCTDSRSENVKSEIPVSCGVTVNDLEASKRLDEGPTEFGEADACCHARLDE